MIWKPKEKSLSEEEAVAMARRELQPWWFGSTPLLAGVKVNDRYSAHPLDKNFHKKGWLIFIVDPTSYSGLSMIPVINEWHRRYGMLNIGFIVVLRFPYHEVYNAKKIQDHFIKQHQIGSIVVVDPDGNLSCAMGGHWNSIPRAVLFNKSTFLHEKSGSKWMDGAEEKIQKLLRSTDPGLPLLIPIESHGTALHETSTFEFGKVFRPAVPADFKVAQLPRLPTIIPPGMLILTGKWEQDDHKILTRDPKAGIAFSSPSSHVGVVARFFHRTQEHTSFAVELNGTPVFDDFHGKDLHPPDDEGQTLLRIAQPWFYQGLRNLPKDQRQVSFRFHRADQVPIGIYGLRFADEI